jgi:hypothetical protein
LFWIWSLITLVPLAGIFVSQCLLLLTRLKPVWATPSAARYGTRVHSMVLGMDGRSGGIRISLRGCFLNTATDTLTAIDKRASELTTAQLSPTAFRSSVRLSSGAAQPDTTRPTCSTLHVAPVAAPTSADHFHPGS